jgi:rhamnopyranosyl-N-acetylglucosaminyl-diphospho-decaprenol beta-1,3/1,4-galactofuranosyltransferase
MEKAIVVVVSYNRRVLLEECINALRKQTRPLDAILVVNNGSTDNTEAWLKDQKDVFFITQNNIGSGGGFHTGIAWAVKNGYSWIWCMDDDGYPTETAFENLMDAPLDRLHLRNSAVVNKDDKKSFVWKTGNYASIDEADSNLIHGIGHPFNGTLLNRWIIERVGLPKKELFLWGDESEYYHRIVSKNNIPVTTVSSSIHYHPASAYSHKNDWDFASNWKMYFYIRNRFHTHKTQFGNKALAAFNYCLFLCAFMGIVLVYQKTDKIKKLSFVFWPAKDAFVNNFKHTPTTILEGLNASDRPLFEGQRRSIANYLRMATMSLSYFYSRRTAVKA